MSDEHSEFQVLRRRKQAAEHAGSEIFSKGLWTCDCGPCTEVRSNSYAVIHSGRCRFCDAPLVAVRITKRYCNVLCRVKWHAQRVRRLKKSHELYPLFERATYVKRCENPAGDREPDNLRGPSARRA